MKSPIITQEQCGWIAEIAWTLWQDFTDLYSQYSAVSLLAPTYFRRGSGTPTVLLPLPGAKLMTRRNQCVTAFFSYCSEIVRGVPASVGDYRLDAAVPNPAKGRATSWLWNFPAQNGTPNPVVTIDSYYLAEKNFLQLPRFWTRLVLHETGHLVLHWRAFETQQSVGSIPVATPKQEAEAWWFSSAIVGLALGEYAHGAKGQGGADHEDTWQYA